MTSLKLEQRNNFLVLKTNFTSNHLMQLTIINKQLDLLWTLPLRCINSVRIRSYSGPYLPAFGLISIQFECGKIRTRVTPNTDTFHAILRMFLFLTQQTLTFQSQGQWLSWNRYFNKSILKLGIKDYFDIL